MSAEGWVETNWGELTTLEYGKSLRDYANHDGEIPVFGTNGRIGFTNKPLCDFASVIVGRKGAYRGIHYSHKSFFFIDTASYLKSKSDELNLKFAYYQLLTYDINSMDSGSAIPSTSRDDFYNLPITLPDLPTQNRIADILSALDDLIELNRQANTTLEAITQAIFKEWFVDFHFPGTTEEMQDSELGPIPKGWRVEKIKNITKKIQYGLTQKASTKEVGPHFLRITDIQKGKIDWSCVPFCIANEKEYEKYRIEKYDIFIARTGASTGENVLVVNQPKSVFASYLVRIQFEMPELSVYVAKFLRTNKYFNFIDGIKGGSAQPNANAQQLTDPELPIPPAELLSKYFQVVSEFEIIKSENQYKNKILAQLRDSLLPKFMSGEIKI